MRKSIYINFLSASRVGATPLGRGTCFLVRRALHGSPSRRGGITLPYVGNGVGLLEGLAEGLAVGLLEGLAVGLLEGSAVGAAVGLIDGSAVGAAVGLLDGTAVGAAVGGGQTADSPSGTVTSSP